MSAESQLQNAILLRYGREPGVTLWRQNTGVCKSEVTSRAHLERLFELFGRCMRLDATAADTGRELVRSLLEDKPRFTPFGLCKGSSDIVGIVTVGQRNNVPYPYGIFIAAEVKTPEPARIKVTDEQAAFLRVVNERGGVGRVVRSVEDMGQLIQDARSL